MITKVLYNPISVDSEKAGAAPALRGNWGPSVDLGKVSIEFFSSCIPGITGPECSRAALLVSFCRMWVEKQAEDL